MKKGCICLIVILLMLLLSGCQTLSHDFKDDEAGQVAKRFFPKLGSLSDSIRSEFEHRKIYSVGLRYEGYFLMLNFGSESEYENYLEQLEHDYHDMTEDQCQNSFFIVSNARFTVDDYDFRAVDTREFGNEDGQYIGLIAHCDSVATVVFLYMWTADASIEEICDGLGEYGYMDYYSNLWRVN